MGRNLSKPAEILRLIRSYYYDHRAKEVRQLIRPIVQYWSIQIGNIITNYYKAKNRRRGQAEMSNYSKRFLIASW